MATSDVSLISKIFKFIATLKGIHTCKTKTAPRPENILIKSKDVKGKKFSNVNF